MASRILILASNLSRKQANAAACISTLHEQVPYVRCRISGFCLLPRQVQRVLRSNARHFFHWHKRSGTQQCAACEHHAAHRRCRKRPAGASSECNHYRAFYTGQRFLPHCFRNFVSSGRRAGRAASLPQLHGPFRSPEQSRPAFHADTTTLATASKNRQYIFSCVAFIENGHHQPAQKKEQKPRRSRR